MKTSCTLTNYCRCGCGTPVNKGSVWIKGHHRRGVKHSSAALQKMKEARMNNIPWNKGIPRTEEEKEAIRQSISKTERKRRSESAKGRWAKGTYDNMYGKTNPACRDEVRLKIGQANKGREWTESARQKISKSRLGKPGCVVSEETKRLHSERMKKDNPMFRKEVLQNHPVLKSGRYFISSGEKIIAQLLKALEIKFQHQKQLAKGKGYYTADFFLTGPGKLIEFDGHQTHHTEKGIKKDQERDAYILKMYGYRTLRLLPSELNNRNRPNLICKIRSFAECP